MGNAQKLVIQAIQQAWGRRVFGVQYITEGERDALLAWAESGAPEIDEVENREDAYDVVAARIFRMQIEERP